MADFKQAIEWMKEGKEVRRLGWYFKQYFLIKHETLCYICHEEKEPKTVTLLLIDMTATDWEIYVEKTKILRCRLDGNALHIFDEGFENLQESPSAFVSLTTEELNNIVALERC